MAGITDLLASRYRREILALLFQNEERGFYQRDISRRLGIPIGNVNREIRRLEEGEGLLNGERLGNLILYRPNKRHPLYKELRSMVLKTVGIPHTLQTALQGLPLELALIFGSCAHEAAGLKDSRWSGTSDIDVMLVGPGVRQAERQLRGPEKQLGRSINPVSYSLEEFGRKIRQKDEFLLEAFRKPVIPLLGLGAKNGLRPRRIRRDVLLKKLKEWKRG